MAAGAQRGTQKKLLEVLQRDLEISFGRQHRSLEELLSDATAERLQIDLRIERLQVELERRMVEQGLADDPRPTLDDDAQIYYRDFWRLAQRHSSLGFGGMSIDVLLDWGHVTTWAEENGRPLDEARDLMWAMRDLREQLENRFVNDKKKT